MIRGNAEYGIRIIYHFFCIFFKVVEYASSEEASSNSSEFTEIVNCALLRSIQRKELLPKLTSRMNGNYEVSWVTFL